MIRGHATSEGTAELHRMHSEMAYHPLGKTKLSVSLAGFGGYRISAGVPAHADALEKALGSGINLIDTSANYTDGGSEKLVGEVIHRLIQTGRISREQVVVISKGGYIQGANEAIRRQRALDGNPFAEVVDYADGLSHCIHPDFLEDQISRSLQRLNVASIDGYLLHNPEYFLGWAAKNKDDPTDARQEYYRRIQNAFMHLEKEVAHGRIRFYGVSSNTLAAAESDPEFTSLHRLLAIAGTISETHHFQVIQLPCNLFEPGAVLNPNQPAEKSVLGLAQESNLGVLINRPLNAFAGNQMVRLASIAIRSRLDYKEIIQRIKTLAVSEARLWRKILPTLDTIPEGIKVRIKQQACFAESLKHHWRSFGNYERWRQAKDGIFLPRIQGVMSYLQPLSENNPDLEAWIGEHEKVLAQAFAAVASIYADEAVRLEKRILTAIDEADTDWRRPGTLSRKAIRTLASTAGVTTVLVGMRQQAYVGEVLSELAASIRQDVRLDSWRRLDRALTAILEQ